MKKIIQVILILILIFSLYKVYDYYSSNKSYNEANAQITDESKKIEEKLEKENPPSREEEINKDEIIKENKIKKVNLLRETNPNILAWINIDDTDIDFPIVQGDDDYYYLDHDINNNYHAFGSIYLAAENDPLFRNQNSIVYGHNIRSGKFFHQLLEYQDRDFLEKHPIIEIVSLEDVLKYEVVAAINMDPAADYRKIDYKDKWDEYYSLISKNNIYGDTPIEIHDKFLTLSTCFNDKYRFVIIAKKILD